MGTHMLTPPPAEWVDPRRNLEGSEPNEDSYDSFGDVIFTCDATGTTTTAVGADATLADGTNVVRAGEKFVLENASGVRKEETVFTVSSAASSTGTTTVTFSPAAATAPVSTDTLRLVTSSPMTSNKSLDERLNAIDTTLYSQANLDHMTQNDKIYALRVYDDSSSF